MSKGGGILVETAGLTTRSAKPKRAETGYAEWWSFRRRKAKPVRESPNREAVVPVSGTEASELAALSTNVKLKSGNGIVAPSVAAPVVETESERTVMLQLPPKPEAGPKKVTRFSNPAGFSGSCQCATPEGPLPRLGPEIEALSHTSGVTVLIVPNVLPPAAFQAQFNWVLDTSVRVNVGGTPLAHTGRASQVVAMATISEGNSLRDLCFMGWWVRVGRA